MSSDKLVAYGVKKLSGKIRKGKVTAVETISAYLNRITRVNPLLNAFLSVASRDELLKQARQADERVVAQPLLGVPIAVKDLINVRGFITTGGTDALKGNLSATDGLVVKRLKDAGAIIIGKTNLDELAFGVTGINYAFGPTRNPVDIKLISGGSSSGSAVAVAAHLAPAALSSDTGGSSRIPASLSGVFGFRPSRERYPINDASVIPISPTLDVVGIAARSVTDIRLLDSVLATVETKLPHISSSSSSSGAEGKYDGKRPLRLGVPKDNFWTNLDASVIPIFKSALDKLHRNGVVLVETPDITAGGETIDQKVLSDSSKQIVAFEYFNALQQYLDRNDVKVTIEDIVRQIKSPDVRMRIEALSAASVSRDAYLQIINVTRPKYQAIYTNYLKLNKLDGILYPTTKVVAQPISSSTFTIQLNTFGSQCQTVPTFETLISTQEFAPFINLPALSIPINNNNSMSRAEAGSKSKAEVKLPIGLEIAGAIGQDDQLLKHAELLENILSS
jgi:Asp-tRNA(Asn)/Glu-tRNA(Gln) amidotransferase A subunit family amidase